MKNYPKPHDKDAVKRFVAFANCYRKFIHNFAEIAQFIVNTKLYFQWKMNKKNKKSVNQLSLINNWTRKGNILIHG